MTFTESYSFFFYSTSVSQMRLAKEAFNIPVYAVLQASAQQQPDGSGRPSSPGGSNRGGLYSTTVGF